VLWRVLSTFPREQWAGIELDSIYSSAGNTRGLLRLYSALLAAPAPDLTIKNNYAATSLLLGLNAEKATRIAAEIYTQSPEDPIVASTYAFSLHQQGRTKEAIAILAKLKDDVRHQHPVSLYYGALLAADGQTARATTYLGTVGKLLPEEERLLEKSRRLVSSNEPARTPP
jgi:Flp pilus assembly protein TadD